MSRSRWARCLTAQSDLARRRPVKTAAPPCASPCRAVLYVEAAAPSCTFGCTLGAGCILGVATRGSLSTLCAKAAGSSLDTHRLGSSTVSAAAQDLLLATRIWCLNPPVNATDARSYHRKPAARPWSWSGSRAASRVSRLWRGSSPTMTHACTRGM